MNLPESLIFGFHGAGGDGSVLFNPSMVFDTIGKNATIQTQTTTSAKVLFQMMISGATATMGVVSSRAGAIMVGRSKVYWQSMILWG